MCLRRFHSHEAIDWLVTCWFGSLVGLRGLAQCEESWSWLHKDIMQNDARHYAFITWDKRISVIMLISLTSAHRRAQSAPWGEAARLSLRVIVLDCISVRERYYPCKKPMRSCVGPGPPVNKLWVGSNPDQAVVKKSHGRKDMLLVTMLQSRMFRTVFVAMLQSWIFEQCL
jgi:hypothetical protein